MNLTIVDISISSLVLLSLFWNRFQSKRERESEKRFYQQTLFDLVRVCRQVKQRVDLMKIETDERFRDADNDLEKVKEVILANLKSLSEENEEEEERELDRVLDEEEEQEEEEDEPQNFQDLPQQRRLI